MDLEIIVIDYDLSWPEQFEEIRAVLGRTLGTLAVAVEHVGSTAVPGLAAKPILDIDVVIPSKDDLPETVNRLAELGYAHQGDLGIAGREAFSRESGRVSNVTQDALARTWPPHHLYVCPMESPELARHLAFRDYLRATPSAARLYAALKRNLAERLPRDRGGYADAKTAFVEAALSRGEADFKESGCN